MTRLLSKWKSNSLPDEYRVDKFFENLHAWIPVYVTLFRLEDNVVLMFSKFIDNLRGSNLVKLLQLTPLATEAAEVGEVM